MDEVQAGTTLTLTLHINDILPSDPLSLPLCHLSSIAVGDNGASFLSALHVPEEADHNPSSPGCLKTILRGSGYRHGLPETDSKPRIRNLFLCSDTSHLICIFTYSEIAVGFLSVRDRAEKLDTEKFVFLSRFKGSLSSDLTPTKRPKSSSLKAPQTGRASAMR